jgi:hypothetical protein
MRCLRTSAGRCSSPSSAVRGYRADKRVEPGTFGDGKPIADLPLQANQLAWFTLEALDRGFVATVVWTMEDAWYDR